MADIKHTISLNSWLLITGKLVKAGREFTASVHRSMKSLSNYPKRLFHFGISVPGIDRFSGFFHIIMGP